MTVLVGVGAEYLDEDRGYADWWWTEGESYDASRLAAYSEDGRRLLEEVDRRRGPLILEDSRLSLLLDYWHAARDEVVKLQQTALEDLRSRAELAERAYNHVKAESLAREEKLCRLELARQSAVREAEGLRMELGRLAAADRRRGELEQVLAEIESRKGRRPRLWRRLVGRLRLSRRHACCLEGLGDGFVRAEELGPGSPRSPLRPGRDGDFSRRRPTWTLRVSTSSDIEGRFVTRESGSSCGGCTGRAPSTSTSTEPTTTRRGVRAPSTSISRFRKRAPRSLDGPISFSGSVQGRRVCCGDSPNAYTFVSTDTEAPLRMTLNQNPFEKQESYSGSMSLNTAQAVLNLVAVKA